MMAGLGQTGKFFLGKVANGNPHRPAKLNNLANARIHLLRAMHDVILIGIGTALSDDPLLTCRLPGMKKRSPIRVILDRNLRLGTGSRLANTARETPVWVIAAPDASPENESALRETGIEIFRSASNAEAIDLVAALRLLADKGITRVLVEGGPRVAASLLNADLVDEAVLLRGAEAIGPAGIDALEGMPLDLSLQSRLALSGQDRLGSDTIELYERR